MLLWFPLDGQRDELAQIQIVGHDVVQDLPTLVVNTQPKRDEKVELEVALPFLISLQLCNAFDRRFLIALIDLVEGLLPELFGLDHVVYELFFFHVDEDSNFNQFVHRRRNLLHLLYLFKFPIYLRSFLGLRLGGLLTTRVATFFSTQSHQNL